MTVAFEGMGSMPSMQMGSLPLAQSMTVSFADWKQDPYNVIVDDANQGLSDFAHQTADFPEEPRAFYQESWGCYFAQKSGAMGNISGTSVFRPQFSTSPAIARLEALPSEDMTSKNNLMTSMQKPDRPFAGNELSLLMDNDIDEELGINKDERASCDVPALALEDLLSPRPTDQVFSPIPMECRESAETLFVSNLLPQFQDIAVDKFEEEADAE